MNDTQAKNDELTDVYTQTCCACKKTFQADSYDDPINGGPPWRQALCCECFAEKKTSKTKRIFSI